MMPNLAKNRRGLFFVILLLIGLTIAIAVVFFQRPNASSQAMAGQAQAALERKDIQLGLLLSARALNDSLQAGQTPSPVTAEAAWQALAASGAGLLNGHENTIFATAISADNHWLITGSDDQTARIWDLTA